MQQLSITFTLIAQQWTTSDASSSSCLVHGVRRRVVCWANQIYESPPFITVLREGFNCGWIEAELVKIAFDHAKPTGAWAPSGSFPAERVRVEVQDSPRRMVRWQAKHMSIPADPAAGSQRGGCPASARTVSLETRSRQWMPRIDLRALLSKLSSLEERVPVSGQVSASFSSTDRTGALYMRSLVVREMDCWRHNGLRSVCITFDDNAHLRSISGLRSPLLVPVEPRYTNESANSTAFPLMFRDGGSGPSPTCISLVFAQLTFKPSLRDSRS